MNFKFPLIDGENEEAIYQSALDTVVTESRGVLNDFTDGQPLGVLLRAQVFLYAELLFYANNIPEKLLLSLLTNMGITIAEGNRAVVPVTFTLTAPQPSPFVIPAGFELRSTQGLTFYTDTALTIPPNTLQGTVSATAKEPGERYNVPAYTIVNFTSPLTFLASVVNTQDAQGGVDAETQEEAIARGVAAIRQRSLTSANDFSRAAEAILGSDSRCKTIGRLGADKFTHKPGAIHVFCASAQDTPSNLAQLARVKAILNDNIVLGTSLYVSPMEFFDVRVSLTVKLADDTSPNEITDRLWDVYQNTLSLRNSEVGAPVIRDEVWYALRSVPGVERITDVRLNGEPLDVAMPNAWTAPSAIAMNVVVITKDGNVFDVARGVLDELEQLA